MGIRLFCAAVIFLFGTFLHEFGHFIAALLLGRPSGFSLVPRRDGDAFVFGEVKARVRYRILGLFVASAPLIWWVLLFLAGNHFIHASSLDDFRQINIAGLLHRLRAVTVRDVLFLWLAFQLLWAGRLSLQDIRTCIKAILSPSGVVFLTVLVLLTQVLRHIAQ